MAGAARTPAAPGHRGPLALQDSASAAPEWLHVSALTRDVPRASTSLRALSSPAQSPLRSVPARGNRETGRNLVRTQTLRIYSPPTVLQCLKIPMTTHPATTTPHTASLPPPPVLLLLPPQHAPDPQTVPADELDPHDLARRATAQTALFKAMFAQTGYPHGGIND
jgi:hypothetical protein